MNQQPVYTVDEFEDESRHLETLMWESIVVERGSKILFCGYGPDGRYVKRAIDAGAAVTVIEHRNEFISKFAKLDAKLLRGSTSVIPAKDNSFDLALSFHYLHEIDPFFHAQVLSELARVARRIAVIEPAPPADPLGKRIALLYSQAKRELGQFEYYQPLEYWKKLLQAVKADVSQHVFAFAKVPPREYLLDTVALLLDTIEVEDAPREFMDELRQIAARSDAQLLPPPRYVLVGAAAGELPAPHFTPRLAKSSVRVAPAAAAPMNEPAERAETIAARHITQQDGYEFPPVQPPPAIVTPSPATPGPAPEPPAPAFNPGPNLPFGVPRPPDAP
ncbi:MAG TPA: methyltransferase domain-containing protein, partial [Candidatus Baltobacteraceae bacterium]|nr:methyltransferase domain-containing protein [Candidatus Baltobacteraceae bacterium]